MKITKFEDLFGKNRSIKLDSPEWRFIQLITLRQCEEAIDIFDRERYYGGTVPRIDTPYGEFTGIDEIKEMVQGWYNVFGAVRATVVPVAQTRAGDRSVTEMVLHCERADGTEHEIPMAAVAEVHKGNKMDELHLYYHWRAVPKSSAYRPPVFAPCKDMATRHEMLSGAVRDYFIYLHSPGNAIIEHADKIFSDRISFGAYEPQNWEKDLELVKREDFVGHFSKEVGHTLSEFVKLRIETIIDDGKICCVEWEQLVTKAGREQAGRISQAGISFYERDDMGRIWSIRIVDYAYAEKEIDWATARKPREEAEKINYLG